MLYTLGKMETFEKLIHTIHDFDPENYKKDWKWQLLSELYENNWNGIFFRKYGKIPKRIHQIWLGSPVPDAYKKWIKSWKRLNPDYEYRLWTDEDVASLKLPNQEAYNSISNPGPKSDILRFHILRQFGGIYVDTDFECLKPFDDLSYLEFYTSVGYPAKVELYPGLIACIPNHPIIEKLTEEIDKVTNLDFLKKGVLSVTSSYFFTNLFFEIITSYQEGIVVFPPDYFYPYPNNFDGFRKVDGRKYIKDFSFAIHYWEQSWNTFIKDKVDWVQGYKFVDVADFTYSPVNKAIDDYAKYPNTFDPEALSRDKVNFIYTCTMYLARLIRIINNLPQYRFVILNHNGDQHVEDGVIGTYANAKKVAEEPYILTENIIKLYTVNPDVIHPRIDMLPVGIENSMWKSMKKEIIFDLRKNKKYVQRTGFALMNYGMSTNREERQRVYALFKPKPWVTTYDKTTYQEFYQLLSTFKFVFNPQGNCFDNHRMWEAWYLGCIPISKRSICIDFYKDFPHVIVDDWGQVTEEFLNEEYDRIHHMNFDQNKLLFAFWKNKVRSLL